MQLPEPAVFSEALALFACGATLALEGQLLHALSDEKLTVTQRRKKIEVCLNQAGSWGELCRVLVKKSIHAGISAHALACMLKGG